MIQRNSPSYIPKPVTQIHPDILNEERWWQFNPELVLTKKASREYRSAHKLMNDLMQSGRLQKDGFVDMGKEGVKSLLSHGKRVSAISQFLNTELQRMGSIMVADTRILARAAMKHDLGKFDPKILEWAMFNGLLPKSNRVAWDQIKRHPGVGRDVVLSMTELCQEERERIAEAILHHHERQDGDGYHKMKPSQVSNEAQIITVADTMDVMMGRRPYKKPATTEECIAELVRCRGTQFNPDVVDAAINIRPSNGEIIYYSFAA